MLRIAFLRFTIVSCHALLHYMMFIHNFVKFNLKQSKR